jgi:calcineurin-like phosphoesterase family protein
MRYELIRRWNSVVNDGDTVFHIGDFSFHNKVDTQDTLLAILHGNIIFLRGNHENHPKTIIESVVIRHEGHSIHLNHYPERANPVMLSLVGHVHDKWKVQYWSNNNPGAYWQNSYIDGKRGFPIVNVGVDVWDFTPVDFETIVKFVRKNSEWR